ncbi:MAG: hypothetical protein FVQ78_10960, partial [Solirubrobacterales bacterium]|nr:hypothetical protein [Solirubrobacterales bacterium]
SLEIGTGAIVSGTFSTIDWGADIYFVQIEMDETGGMAYQLMGTSQLLSVPYALYAEKTANTNDADADSTNELQTLSVIGNDLTISSGNTVTLTDNVTDADADPTNELQAISISNDTIYLSNGGFVTLPTDQTADADADPTNELQVLSISNDTIYLSNGANVYLGSYLDNTDNQTLSFSGDTLNISGGNNVIITDNVIDADADSANELQTLSLSNDTLNISSGNSVILTDADPTNELQNFSTSGDTLFISNSNFVIIPGLYAANRVCGDSVQDADGNWYDIVKIGSQCWLKENMRTTKYPGGGAITKGPAAAGSDWTVDSAWYSCPPDVANGAEDCAAAASLGMLYQWSAAMERCNGWFNSRRRSGCLSCRLAYSNRCRME